MSRATKTKALASFRVWIPEDLVRMLTAVAHQNNRTLNQEIIYRLRHSLDQYRRQHSVESEPR